MDNINDNNVNVDSYNDTFIGARDFDNVGQKTRSGDVKRNLACCCRV
jgi:hypothetical protein